MRSPPKVHGRGAVEMLTESENKSCTLSLSHPRHYHHPVFTFGPMHPTTCPFHALLSCRSWSRNNYILPHGAITRTLFFPSNTQCSMRYVCHFNWRDKPKEGEKNWVNWVYSWDSKSKAGICLWRAFRELVTQRPAKKNIKKKKIAHGGFTAIAFIQHEPHKPQLQVAGDTLNVASVVRRLCVFLFTSTMITHVVKNKLVFKNHFLQHLVGS